MIAPSVRAVETRNELSSFEEPELRWLMEQLREALA